MLANCKGNRPCQILKLPIGLYKTIQCKKSAHPTEYVFLTKNGGGLKSFLVFCLLLTNSRPRCRKLAGSTLWENAAKSTENFISKIIYCCKNYKTNLILPI